MSMNRRAEADDRRGRLSGLASRWGRAALMAVLLGIALTGAAYVATPTTLSRVRGTRTIDVPVGGKEPRHRPVPAMMISTRLSERHRVEPAAKAARPSIARESDDEDPRLGE